MNLEGVLIEDQKQDTLLYAGVMQVRITDWFFLKDKAELKYIGLENGVIYFNRTDSVWNYQYLADYFDKPGTGKKESGIDFNLKKVKMRNITFRQIDEWFGRNMLVQVSGLELDADDINTSRRVIDISNLRLVDPYFHQFDYPGKRPKKPAAPKEESEKGSLNPQNWVMHAERIQIENGRFKSDKGSLTATLNHFDGRHIDFRQINGSIRNLVLSSDTLTAKLELSAKERSGLLVQSLKSDVKVHPQLMEFDNLFVKTNRSQLEHYFSMRFDGIDEMNDFIHSVRLFAHFQNSSISSDDIAFFAPEAKKWNRTFRIDGDIKGTIDALTGEDVNIRAGLSTAVSGDFTLVGLPNINQTYINIEASDLRTNYPDAITFFPNLRSVKTPNLNKLGAIRFQGNFTGFINDFVTYGTLNTNLGTLVTDLNMKLPKYGQPTYSGKISTTSFRLGEFINNADIGIVAFTGNVKGRGFKWQELDMNIDGTIDRFEYGRYTYQNITAKGRFNNRAFNGDFVINDPNADLSLSGLISFEGKEPLFDLKADIVKANLKELQLLKEDLSLSGQFNLQFRGRSIGDFLGNASIQQATLLHNGQRLSFDSLVIDSRYYNGIRTFTARSNEFDATVTGQFDLKSLPDAFTRFLHRYYPAYIKPPRTNIPNQNFTFEITTGVVEDYIKLIDNRLSGFNNSYLTGSLNLSANSLTLDANVPFFSFDKYDFNDVQLKADGNFERLLVDGQVINTTISDTLNMPNTIFTIQAQNDISDINITTSSNFAINQANLSAQVKTFSNGVSVKFNPSSFVLNSKTWTIEEGGELDFRKNTVVQGHLVLKESNQSIRLSTHPSSIGDWSDLHVDLENINLGDITPLFIKAPRIEGLVSGELMVEDPQKRFNISGAIAADQVRIDNDSIGQIQGSVFYNNSTGLLTAKGNNLDPEKKILFDLALDLKDPENAHRDRISLEPINYPVTILERFIGNLFSDLQGTLTGKLDLLESGKNFVYVGKGRLRNAGLKVNFTQVFYTIDDTEIVLTERELNLGTLKLRDKDGATATVRGVIYHNSWQDMVYDIEAEVDDEPMQLINTTYNDNQQFYGRAKGTGFLKLVGPQYDMNMYIEAEPSTIDSSYITIPPSKSRASGSAVFMVERKYGVEMTPDRLRGSTSNITYQVNLNATPMVNLEMILDDLTGDYIRGHGTGNLYLQAGTTEPLTMRGHIDIQDGLYLFTFQSLFKKPFELRRGGNNYIQWSGDPYDANIRVEAVYTAENVSFAPLASTLSIDQNFARYRGDVNVVALLTGKLFQPEFTFRIEFPENSTARNNPSLAFGIQQIERNTNELNKQVSSLIVFNSFAPYESGQTTYNPFSELAYSTISGLLFNEINRRLSQLFSQIFRDDELTFNFTGSLYNRNLISESAKGFNINQTDFIFSFGRSFLNDRAQITFGGTFDIPIDAELDQTIRVFPDVNVEIMLNKSGSVRATFFYAQNDPFIITTQTGRNQRAGAKLSYRKEFNSIGEFLFGKKNGKRKKQPAPSAPPALPLGDSTVVPVDSTDNQ